MAYRKIGTSNKVPTEIAYTKDGIRWGSDISPNMARHMRTKLLFDRRQGGIEDRIVQEMALVSLGAHKRPVEIRLRELLPLVLLVTVPAVWSDIAKNRTLQAFNIAGFNAPDFPQLERIITLAEPEAAAIHTIKTLRESTQDQELDIGDGFVVCEMGADTIDLIAYTVANLQPIVVAEATVGIGHQCGATSVDRGFVYWLEEVLGADDFWKIAGCRAKDICHTSPSRWLGRLISDFVIEAKTEFSGTQHNYIRLPSVLNRFDEDEARGTFDGEIKITPEQMANFFNACIDGTIALIQEQLDQVACHGETRVKYIVLVGGFADSPYVYAQVKAFGERIGVTVIRPPYVSSAVVRGGAAKGLENLKSSTGVDVYEKAEINVDFTRVPDSTAQMFRNSSGRVYHQI
ncbi:hypothetical protein NX059_007703 [Plenodomus lindquistii]|nr:hypothetical protein NX059_007703 [Plenodomus lindquistii]